MPWRDHQLLHSKAMRGYATGATIAQPNNTFQNSIMDSHSVACMRTFLVSAAALRTCCNGCSLHQARPGPCEQQTQEAEKATAQARIKTVGEWMPQTQMPAGPARLAPSAPTAVTLSTTPRLLLPHSGDHVQNSHCPCQVLVPVPHKARDRQNCL